MHLPDALHLLDVCDHPLNFSCSRVPRPPARLQPRLHRMPHVKLTPTPLTAAIAGIFAGVAMPLIWPKLGDETMYWVFAFLLVIALPTHVLVVGINPARNGEGRGGIDAATLKRVAIWLAAGIASVALMKIVAP
jgi:hypothetical protein